jgi:hypothetical protein
MLVEFLSNNETSFYKLSKYRFHRSTHKIILHKVPILSSIQFQDETN